MLSFCKIVSVIFIVYNIEPIITESTNNTKFILLWTLADGDFEGKVNVDLQKQILSDCPHKNCYFTKDKNLLGYGAENSFDAILFNGRYLHDFKNESHIPSNRNKGAKYIFVYAESGCPGNETGCKYTEPICNPLFDNYFNLMASFVKGSDIMLTMDENIFRKKNYRTYKDHIIIGFNDSKLRTKKKAAVWFVPNCTIVPKQLEYAKELNQALSEKGFTLDIYGCGESNVTDDSKEWDVQKEDYYFYLDFDASYCNKEHKCPLGKNSVPIVYKRENYSRFMALGTFIDAARYKPEVLASYISGAIKNPTNYNRFFLLRDINNLYIPTNALSFICSICSGVNNEKIMSQNKIYKKFRHKWFPDYEKICDVGDVVNSG